MSITPSTPSINLKSFWQRPEGKTGALVLLASIGAGVYGFSLLLPWLIALMANTLYAAGEAVALFALLYLVFDKTFRSIVKNAFQLSTRWMTGLLVEIDPIGIQKNYLDEMREQKAKLDNGVSGCAGAKEGLERNINKNNSAIRHDKSLVEEVNRRMSLTRDPLATRGLEFERQRHLQDIGRKMSTNANLQKTLDMTNDLYSKFQRMQQLGDYNIENLAAQIENDEQERQAILEAYKALSPAQKLIRGEPEALKMFNASREFLARDNARMVGAMKDFAAYGEKYLNTMDIEQGAAAADAEKLLAGLEQSMQLTAGTATSGVGTPSPRTAEAVPVPRSKNTLDGDYMDFSK